MTRKAAGSPPPHSAPGDQDQDWGCERERGRDRRGRSRDPAPQAGWAHPGHPRGRPPQRDPSPPALETPAPTPGREHRRRGPGPPSQDGDAVSYQEVVALAGDRKPQNPIQDNMENYRKLLSLGVQLAENDGHSHLTHGHPSRSRRGAHPSTSRGVKAAPEARKPAHRRGICEDESSHGVIMEKFLKDVSRSPRPGRARECGGRPLGPPRWPDQGRKGLPPPQREPRPQARGSGRHALAGGGFPSHCSLAPQRRVLERKRRYHLDPDAKGPGQEQGGCARKRPTVGGEARPAAGSSSLGAPPAAGLPPAAAAPALPYVCDECGRSFGVVSEFVEHQIMHTRESLYQYGESFSRSLAVSQAQRRRAGASRGERKGGGGSPGESATPTGRRKSHSRERPGERPAGGPEEPFMPSPTFSELQRMYGRDKFYECPLCRETFLHSSALLDHQQAHGRGASPDARERGEALRPGPTLSELQKTHGREKPRACKVCGEAFQHGACLREHRQAHARGRPAEGQSKPLEETAGPGQLRRQKARSREGLYGLQDGGDAFRPRPDLGEPLKTPAWKNLYGGRGRGREQAGGQGGPCADSQRSHTITRPPEDGEDQRAFATGASPAGARVAPAKEAKCEEEPRALSVIHSPSAGAQRSRGAGAPGRLNVTAGPSSQSAAAAPRDGRPGGERERPGILRPAALQGPRTHGGAGPIAQGGEKAGACACPSEVSGKRQDSRCAESPPRGSAGDGRTGGVARSLSPLQPREGLVGETGELKKDSASPAPSPQGLGHQKARAKRKNIEQGGPGACGSPSPRPRERAHECRVCGVSFALSAELAEHQKVHGRKCTVGETRGPSVICSLASASPQMSHVPRLAQARDPGPAVQANSPTEPARAGPTEQLAPRECRERGVHFTTLEGPGAHQKVYGGEQVHGGGLLGASVQGTGREGALQEEQPPQVELGEPHGDGDGDEDDDAIYGCGDCGLGFADRADLKDHQKVHSRVYPADARTPPRTVARLPRVSEYQQDLTGEQLYECPACGESFVHSAFLFEHQKIHEQDQFYGFRRLDEPFLRPLILGPRRPRAPQKVPRALTPLHCQVCGQDFIHASLLVEHMQAHPRARLPALGQPSEDTTGPSLALAELQRSQAEEKQHECETCGAAFLSRAALREHLHVHRRGQPYAYGASFVHASFLTEPPKRDMPFFECKDCGETFVHNTVLLRHQKLHLEEEDAAVSQEAEANVLVPREVLCIQGSSVEAAEPEVEAAEPAGEARGPGGEAEQPHDGDADEPDGAGILDPEERAEEPEGDADEPDGAGVHDPEEAGGAQEARGDGPSCGQPEGTLLPLPACGQRLPAHAGVIMFEPARVSGEGSRCRASTSSGDGGGAGSGRFRCPICGQLFRDRLSLARHQDAHTG